MSFLPGWLAGLLAGTALAAERAERFGFTGPEVFPIDFGTAFLRPADFDGDGLTDLVVVNNARSRLTLLYNQTGRTNTAAAAKDETRRELNELPPDARFRIDSISSEKRISSLAVDDFNGDRRPDLAYFGDPKELVVQYNQGTNAWSTPRRFELSDGLLDANALSAGDLDGDGRSDLLLLAEKHVYLLRQRADGTLAEPEKLPYTGTVKAVQVLDVDGDRREDLVLVNWDSPTPFRFRLQNAAHQLGPEVHLPLAPVRSYWADDLDGDRRTEVLTIAAKSGRAAVANFSRQPAEAIATGMVDGQFLVLPLPRTDKPRRGLVWADVTRDGRADLVVADPDSGQLVVHAQDASGTLLSPRTYPTLGGVVDIAVGDWNGDGAPEVFLLSGDEKQVGVVSVEAGGRIGFPRPLPFPGRPLVMALGELVPGRRVLAAITEREEKRPGKDDKPESVMVRELVLLHAAGETVTQVLADTFKGLPTSLAFHDMDQDGRRDLVVLTPYEKIKVLRQLETAVDGRRLEEIDVNPPGGATDRPWLAAADADGDGRSELLLAQKNFLRAVVLRKEGQGTWNFDVRDQINGATSTSRIVGATAVPVPGQKAPALFLFDAERKALTVCLKDTNGVWQPGRNLALPVTDFTSLESVSLGSAPDRPNAVLLLGANGVAWKHLTGEVWDLKELDGYETPIKDGFLADVTSGDLNQDGRKDLVFLEMRRAYVDLVMFEPPHRLVPANRWQVFEERTFRQRRPVETPEPREAVIVDLTGDGKADLAVLVHDRVLLYPQE